MGKFGKFVGEVKTQWLKNRGNDRNMLLLEDFSYIDQDGKRWDASAGSEINGTSIPRMAWREIGPPYVGDYRRASVVHDVACEKQSEPHEAAHRMFYNAMRCDGVRRVKAMAMYQAVKRFGPTWGTDSEESMLLASASSQQPLMKYAELEEIVKQAINSTPKNASFERIDSEISAMIKQNKHSNSRAKNTSKSAQKLPKVTKLQNHTKLPSPNPLPESMSFLSSAAKAVKSDLAGSIDIPAFRQISSSLTHAEQIRLIDQALVLIEQNYVHLPFKESMHGSNPVQKLKILLNELHYSQNQEPIDDHRFHQKMIEIFMSLRDLHTNYFLPSPFNHMTAFVPFIIEPYSEDGEHRYIVSHIFDGFEPLFFEKGVEIIRWNGIPISKAVEINGNRYAGSNEFARHARGVETLTVRPLLRNLPPDEERVIVDYLALDGTEHEIRVNWVIFSPESSINESNMDQKIETSLGIDLELDLVKRAKKILFAPKVVAKEKKIARQQKKPVKGVGLNSIMPSTFEARVVNSSRGKLGYIRIRTFSTDSLQGFKSEFIRLIELLPSEGLIIDVRGNGGGLILAAEEILQLLTPHIIKPTLFQFINTPLNLAICEGNPFLKEWVRSIRQSERIGSIYSQGFPITDVEAANAIGQRYFGPTVLITDPLCYSATDLFAAGFKDHQIGPILGVDGSTGAGGANVWTHTLLSSLLQPDSSLYQPLPSGAGFRVSIRRALRRGPQAGTIIEDLGIAPDFLYEMTKDDLLDSNIDLINRAAELIEDMPTYYLSVQEIEQTDDGLLIEILAEGIDYVDVFANSRAQGSIDLSDGIIQLLIPVNSVSMLELQGFESGKLVAARKIILSKN